MLGHHLLTITRGAEERLLRRPFKPYVEVASAYPRDWQATVTNRCYMQVVHPKTTGIQAFTIGYDPCYPRRMTPAHQYELLCKKFGSQRINRAIRNRILNNQLWRAQIAERDKRKEAVQPEGRSNLVREPALQ